MNLIYLHAVRVAFSLRQQAVDLLRIYFHSIREVQVPDGLVNLSQGMVMMYVSMCMIMIRYMLVYMFGVMSTCVGMDIILLAAIHEDCHMCSGDAALL